MAELRKMDASVDVNWFVKSEGKERNNPQGRDGGVSVKAVSLIREIPVERQSDIKRALSAVVKALPRISTDEQRVVGLCLASDFSFDSLCERAKIQPSRQSSPGLTAAQKRTIEQLTNAGVTVTSEQIEQLKKQTLAARAAKKAAKKSAKG